MVELADIAAQIWAAKGTRDFVEDDDIWHLVGGERRAFVEPRGNPLGSVNAGQVRVVLPTTDVLVVAQSLLGVP